MTDFGEDDFFVASLKAVILNINPRARIVDISHQVQSFDIRSAAFILSSCYKFFPAKTIFLTVVDPGVGSLRRILLVETENYFFIAPDNGLLSFVLEREDFPKIREVKNPRFFLPQPSRTFEGRDKMAPVAAWLSKGLACSEFGPQTSDYLKLEIQKPQRRKDEIIGSILYIDKFGNMITNIPGEMVFGQGKGHLSLLVGRKEVSSFQETFSSAKKGELFFLIGSLDLVEIAAREASASTKLKAGTGDEVRIRIRR